MKKDLEKELENLKKILDERRLAEEGLFCPACNIQLKVKEMASVKKEIKYGCCQCPYTDTRYYGN